MSDDAIRPRPVIGWAAFLIGAVALLMAVTLFWAGPFAPQQTAGVSLGELAVDIGQAAARKVAGLEQPAPQPVPRDIDDLLEIGVALLGGLAIIIGAAALIRRETKGPPIAATVFGASAILFQFFAWYAIALLCVLLIIGIFHSLSDTFTAFLGG